MNIENLKPQFKKPKQLRSKMTVDAIIEASAIIISKEGLKGFNTNKIAKIAGVSIASLYQYFPNKESIFMALVESYFKKKFNVLKEAISKGLDENESIDNIINNTINARFDFELKHPGLNKILSEEAEELGLIELIKNTEDNFILDIVNYICLNNSNLDKKKIQKKFIIIVSAIKGINKSIFEDSNKLSEEIEDLKMETTLFIKNYLGENFLEV